MEERYPEKLDVIYTVQSEARILGFEMRRTFLVGMPLVIWGQVKNAGRTPLPAHPPQGWEWELELLISWSDGRTTRLETRSATQLKAGETMQFGPFRTSVVAPGYFHAELTYPFVQKHLDEDGQSHGSLSGTERRALMEGVAVDMNTIRTRWSLWVSLITLLLVLFGLWFGIRP